jgi:hypothetical protein
LVNVLLGRTVFGLARTLFDLQTFIANLFLMQGVNEVFQQTQAVRDTFTPTQILRSIVQVFTTPPLSTRQSYLASSCLRPLSSATFRSPLPTSR